MEKKKETTTTTTTKPTINNHQPVGQVNIDT